MNKYSKGKNIGIVTAALATVALVGVGFSTWVIGYQSKETNGDVTVTADDVEYKSLILSAEVASNDGINLAGKNSEASSSNVNFSFNNKDNKGEEDLEISVTFTLSVGKNFGDLQNQLDKISFAIDENKGEGYVDGNAANDANKLGNLRTGETWTYITAPEAIDFVISTEDNTKGFFLDNSTKNSAIMKYSFVKTLSFGWGSFFNNKNPIQYYNELLTGDNLNDTNIANVGAELEAMQTAYNNKKINLKMSLGLKTSSGN